MIVRANALPIPRLETWHVVHTQPQHEMRAATQLKLQGYKVFLPQIEKSVRHARKFRRIRAPFFPRYLFIALDLEVDRWRSVNGTLGVSNLIMANDRPARAPTELVEGLMALSLDGGLLEFSPRLRPGQKVQVLSGPFAERIGELQRIDETGRARILLELLGGEIPVWFHARVLAPVA